MEGLGACGVNVVATKNLGLVLGVFFSLSFFCSSPMLWSSFSCSLSLSPYYDIGNSFGHIFPSRVIYYTILRVFVNFIEGSDEIRDSVDGVSIGWLVCMGARLNVVSGASLAFLRVVVLCNAVLAYLCYIT